MAGGWLFSCFKAKKSKKKENKKRYSFTDAPRDELNSSKTDYNDVECKIINLDAVEHTFYVNKKALGAKLYENIFKQLEFSQEQDYFALQYTDSKKILQWLDPTKEIRKQCVGPPYSLTFQVKFYSSDPHNLHEEVTRYFFVLQLRQDIRTGRLPCDEELGSELAALCLQGDTIYV